MVIVARGLIRERYEGGVSGSLRGVDVDVPEGEFVAIRARPAAGSRRC